MLTTKDIFMGAWMRNKTTGDYVQVISEAIWQEAQKQCEPIPITTPVLKKLGFVRNGAASYLYVGTFTISMIHFDSQKHQLVIFGSDRTYQPMLNIDIRYFHHLQLAFILCGVDIPIDLNSGNRKWQH